MDKKLNVDKIIKNTNEAISDKDHVKMMEIHNIIEEATEEDKFSHYLYDEGEEVKLKISKDFNLITLNKEECIEVFKSLNYANEFDWKIPF